MGALKIKTQSTNPGKYVWLWDVRKWKKEGGGKGTWVLSAKITLFVSS